MKTDDRKNHELNNTVRNLGKEVRLWKGLVSLQFLVLILAVCAGGRPLQDIPDVVTARQGFVLKDKVGRVRAVLGFDQIDGRVGLVLLDETGRARTEFTLDKAMDRYGMYVRDNQDRDRMFMGFFKDQYSFELSDKEKTNRLAIAQLEDSGDSGLAVRDKNGVSRLGLGQFVNESDGTKWVGMTIQDRDEHKRLQLFCDIADTLSVIRVMDHMGQDPRIGMGVTYGNDEMAHFSVWGGKKKERVSIDVGKNDKMRIELKNKDNHTVDLMSRNHKE